MIIENKQVYIIIFNDHWQWSLRMIIGDKCVYIVIFFKARATFFNILFINTADEEDIGRYAFISIRIE